MRQDNFIDRRKSKKRRKRSKMPQPTASDKNIDFGDRNEGQVNNFITQDSVHNFDESPITMKHGTVTLIRDKCLCVLCRKYE